MARNETHIAAAPDAVFSVLSDPDAYGDWVVGSRRIRDADADFPAVGSKFHHQVGVPPFLLDNVRGARECVRHMIQKGHRRIAIITGSLDLHDRSVDGADLEGRHEHSQS